MSDVMADNPKSGQIVTLDPTMYAPTPDEVLFLKKWTGIDDDEELKQHVLTVQKEAWDVSIQKALFP